MKILRYLLKTIMAMIYIALALMVLYFPLCELMSYVGRETRLFSIRLYIPPEDALLPAFVLAVLYALVSPLLRKMEQKRAAEKDE